MPTSYLVEVKPSVFAETSLTEPDFDATSNMSLSAGELDDNICMKFLTREGAEGWVGNLVLKDTRIGKGASFSAAPTEMMSPT